MKFFVIKVNEEIHKLAKHRSKFLGKSLKKYISELVLDDIELAEKLTKYDSEKDLDQLVLPKN